MKYNKLLERQINKYLGNDAIIPESMYLLLKGISDSYDHYEKDRKMLERSIELSSQEMIELNNQLRSETEELKKANLELDKFVYSVSHDLRAPLLSLKGLVAITKKTSSEELTQNHMDMILGTIERLDGFIKEILDYSRNTRFDIRVEKIDFDNLLDDIKDNLRFMGSIENMICERNINIIDSFYSDKVRIEVILNNLISNAIGYANTASSNSFVKVNITADKKRAVISVEDNGIGIEEKYHEKIYEMFYRASEASKGSGLGLYIVKETVTKLNGTISLTSQPDIGTTFIITLPNLYDHGR
jgi:signal transduction histidine kinase